MKCGGRPRSLRSSEWMRNDGVRCGSGQDLLFPLVVQVLLNQTLLILLLSISSCLTPKLLLPLHLCHQVGLIHFAGLPLTVRTERDKVRANREQFSYSGSTAKESKLKREELRTKIPMYRLFSSSSISFIFSISLFSSSLSLDSSICFCMFMSTVEQRNKHTDTLQSVNLSQQYLIRRSHMFQAAIQTQYAAADTKHL